MHNEAYTFVAAAALEQLPSFDGLAVLEFGSYDVNGSVRPIFDGADYHGVDIRPGNGVDEAADASEYDGAGKYDVVVSTETLEHAPDPRAVIASARRALKKGGLLIATMASPERAPHSVDGQPKLGKDEHYGNISEDDLRGFLGRGWDILTIEHHAERGDLYVVARKGEW